MKLRTLLDRSGAKTILWAFLAWLATSLPQWVEAVELAAPWGGIAAAAAAFIAAVIRLLIAFYNDPSVPAIELPNAAIAQMSREDQAAVVKAEHRKRA